MKGNFITEPESRGGRGGGGRISSGDTDINLL